MAKKETTAKKKPTKAKNVKPVVSEEIKVQEEKTKDIEQEITDIEKDLDKLHIVGSEVETAIPTIDVDFNDVEAEEPQENKEPQKPKKSILRDFFGVTWNGMTVDY